MLKIADIIASIAYAIFVVAALLSLVAGFAAVFYFGVPFVTGYDELSFWQYFVAIILVVLLSHIIFSGISKSNGSNGGNDRAE